MSSSKEPREAGTGARVAASAPWQQSRTAVREVLHGHVLTPRAILGLLLSRLGPVMASACIPTTPPRPSHSVWVDASGMVRASEVIFLHPADAPGMVCP